MSNAKRISHIFTGFMMILAATILMCFPDEGHEIVALILDISLLIYGIRLMIYYFTMARFMTGGIMTLYKSMIIIDLGLFVVNMERAPQKLIMLYLVLILIFDGFVDILKSLDTRKIESSAWIQQFLFGLVELGIGITSIFFLNSVRLMTYIFCIGLINSAIYHVILAFRKTGIAYAK